MFYKATNLPGFNHSRFYQVHSSFKATSCIFKAFTVFTAFCMVSPYIHPWVSTDTQLSALSSIGMLITVLYIFCSDLHFTWMPASILLLLLEPCHNCSQFYYHPVLLLILLSSWLSEMWLSKTSCLLNEDYFIVYTPHYLGMLPITEVIWRTLLLLFSTNGRVSFFFF